MVLLDNLQGYWTLDEFSDGSGAVSRLDSTANNNDLTDINTTPSGAGKISLGGDFEKGNLENLSIADGSQTGLDFTGDFSLSTWIKAESLPFQDASAMASRYESAERNWRFVLFDTDDAGTYGLRLTIVNSVGTAENLEKVWALSASTFYHVVFRWDASTSTVEYFINNSSLGTVAGALTDVADNPAPFNIGSRGDNAWTFDGIIDEMGVWDRLLTDEEIGQLYNGGAGLAYPLTPAAPNTNFLAVL